MTIENAPPHIKLAIDIIQLLEENDIENQLAIDALKIVLNDFQQKQATIEQDN